MSMSPPLISLTTTAPAGVTSSAGGSAVTAISDVAFAGFAARLAMLMSAGDTSGTGTLAHVFVGANVGAAGPEREHELLDLAGAIGAAFPPGALEAILRALEDDLAAQLDDAGE